jgi:hypothetical protein
VSRSVWKSTDKSTAESTDKTALPPKFLKLKSELLNLASLLPYEPLPPAQVAATAAAAPMLAAAAPVLAAAAPATAAAGPALALRDGAAAAGQEATALAVGGGSAVPSWAAQGIEVARYDHPAWADDVRAAEVLFIKTCHSNEIIHAL